MAWNINSGELLYFNVRNLGGGRYSVTIREGRNTIFKPKCINNHDVVEFSKPQSP